MKIAIIGSRNYLNKEIVINAVKEYLSINDILISGGAIGVDSWAETAAKKLGIQTDVYIPDYETYGKGAPLKRNSQIAQVAEYVIAFWDGKSRGTIDTIKKFKALNKPYIIFGPDGKQLK